jgi:myo-inositol-1(or 4)-monophosphatase
VDRDGLRRAARVAGEVAREAGALIRERFSLPRQIGTKSASIDLVTDTDRAADELIARRLATAFPTHAVISEEGGSRLPLGAAASAAAPTGAPTAPPALPPEIHWVIDPLDGTTNFAHGFPQFAVSIAAVAGLDPRDPLATPSSHGAQVVVGVVYDPMRDELFAATLGDPATRNDEPIAVTGETRLDACLVATGFPYDRRQRVDYYLRFWREMMLRCRDVRRVGAAALDLAWVACGRLDGFWEWNLHAWDIAAGALIVRQAGGAATDFNGVELAVDARQTLATNGRVHEAMRAILLPLVEPAGRAREER